MSNGPPSTSSALTAAKSPPAAQPIFSRTTFHLTAGLFSGFTSAILLQPADLLKTRVQQSRSTSLFTTLRQILSGPSPVRQLWRGTLPSTIRTSVGSALYFTSLNALRTRLAALPSATAGASASSKPVSANASSSALPRLSASANLLSGAVARASVGFVMMPITVLKVRYESSLYSSYRSLWGAAHAIYAAEGVKGFFAGFGATAIRDAPYAGLYVLFYEWGKRAFGELVAITPTTLGTEEAKGRTGMKSSTSAMVNFGAGALAASAATAVTNPPDAIKTRLQLRPERYRNTMQAAKLMLQEEGLRSMFDGLGLRMARKALSSALAWTVYEEVVRRAEKRFVLGI